MKTRREKIAELLTQNSMAPSEIAKALDMSVKDVIEDLHHISKSKKYGMLLVQPARCKSCGFAFQPKISVPKKCPKCKSMWIEEPKFKIVKNSLR